MDEDSDMDDEGDEEDEEMVSCMRESSDVQMEAFEEELDAMVRPHVEALAKYRTTKGPAQSLPQVMKGPRRTLKNG